MKQTHIIGAALLLLVGAMMPATAYHILSPMLGKEQAAELVSRTAFAVTIMFPLWQAWKAWLHPSWDRFAQASFNVLAFYLLVTILWFQQWYTLWLLGLVPLLRSRAAQNVGIFIGFAVLVKQFIVAPYLYLPRPRFNQPWFEMAFTLGVLGLPWLFTLFTLWRERRSRLIDTGQIYSEDRPEESSPPPVRQPARNP